MDINWVTVLVSLVAGLTPLLISIYNNLANKKTNDMASIVANTEKIREISSELLDDAEKRWKEKFDDQSKEYGEKLGKLRERLENEARQKQGELMVELEAQKERNNQLKIQIAELGGYVQGATGDIYKRFPMDRPKAD